MRGLVAWVLSMLAVCIAGQTVNAGSVTGMITDYKTGEPVVFASVQVDGTTQGTVADSSGGFELQKVGPKKNWKTRPVITALIA